MLLVPGDPDCRSAGSFFKNPVLTREAYRALVETAGPEVPSYATGEGTMKVSAAWLVERAGYVKGMAFGEAGISTRHSLALINRGHAAARELIDLARGIRRTVQARFGVLLEPEPVLLGFEQSLDS
jgi:UDP-N-acetylmuramate dehydrogenase